MNRILSIRPGNFELGIPILLFVQEFTERNQHLVHTTPAKTNANTMRRTGMDSPTGRSLPCYPLLRTPNDPTNDRLLAFEKLLCVCECRVGTVQRVSPNEQRCHLFFEITLRPRTWLNDGPSRLVEVGTKQTVLVGVVERGIRSRASSGVTLWPHIS